MPIRVARFVIARNAPGILKSSGNSGTRSAGKCGKAIIYYQKHVNKIIGIISIYMLMKPFCDLLLPFSLLWPHHDLQSLILTYCASE